MRIHSEGSMESMKREQHSAQFKTKVALEALKGQNTMNEWLPGMGSIPPRSDAGNISWRWESRKFSPTAMRDGLKSERDSLWLLCRALVI